VFTGDRYHPLSQLSIARATAKQRWTDWQIVHREDGRFTGQPQVDRYERAGRLAVYIQEQPNEAGSTAGPLRVITFRATN